MSKWSEMGKRAKSAGGSGLFVSVESDQPGVEFLVPPGMTPYERYIKWPKNGGPPEDVDRGGPDIQCKILLSVVRANGEPGILEIPPGTFADLCACLDHPKVGGVEQIYEVSKTGSGMKTRWKMQRIDRATPEQIAIAARATLPEPNKGRPMGEAPPKPPSVATQDIREPGDEQPDESIPF